MIEMQKIKPCIRNRS